MKLYARVGSLKRRRVLTFEDEVLIFANSKSELNEAKLKKTKYQKIVSLPVGTYKVDVLFWDVLSKRRGLEQEGFMVTNNLRKP